MGIFSLFFKKKKEPQKPIITEDDARELQEIQRKTYMEEARKICVERGKILAEEQLKIKPKEDKSWDL